MALVLRITNSGELTRNKEFMPRSSAMCLGDCGFGAGSVVMYGGQRVLQLMNDKLRDTRVKVASNTVNSRCIQCCSHAVMCKKHILAIPSCRYLDILREIFSLRLRHVLAMGPIIVRALPMALIMINASQARNLKCRAGMKSDCRPRAAAVSDAESEHVRRIT